jgi:hypothetical protein
MARPKKNNAEYYPHDADMRNDVRVKAVRRKFKHTGYAVWNYLLETLTDSDYFEVEWDEINIELLAADYDVSVQELQDIVEYCVFIGLFQREGNKLYSEAHKKRFSPLLANRERKRVMDSHNPAETPENRVSERHNPTEAPEERESGNPKPHSKEKEIKGNESKGEKREEFDFSFCPPDYLPVIQDWLTYKRKRRESYKTQKSLEALYRKLNTLSGGDVEIAKMIVEQSQASNWAGLFELKSDAAAAQNVKLGYGERIENGRRTYGTGKATIPMNAAPRPSERHSWDSSTQKWIML